MALLVTGLSVGAQAQTPETPLNDDFVFRRPLPLDLPPRDQQHAHSWPHDWSATELYGPPPKPEPDFIRRASTDTKSVKNSCVNWAIPDGGFDLYMEQRALEKGRTGEAEMRSRNRASWPGYCNSRQ